jgi:hypothetical protein
MALFVGDVKNALLPNVLLEKTRYLKPYESYVNGGKQDV